MNTNRRRPAPMGAIPAPAVTVAPHRPLGAQFPLAIPPESSSTTGVRSRPAEGNSFEEAFGSGSTFATSTVTDPVLTHFALHHHHQPNPDADTPHPVPPPAIVSETPIRRAMMQARHQSAAASMITDTYEPEAIAGLPQTNNRTDKLLQGHDNKWRCPTETEWHILRLTDKDEEEFIKSALAKHRAEKATDDKPAVQIEMYKFLCLRYESPENEKLFKYKEKCMGMDARNKIRYFINSKLMGIVDTNIMVPLYQKAPKVPQPEQLAEIASERYDRFCSAEKIRIAKAVKYLKKRHNMVAEVDYKIKNAIEVCNDKAFNDAIEMAIERHKGKIPIRLTGQRPARWNGRDEVDSRGIRIRWKKGDGFSFLRPELITWEHWAPAAPEPEFVVVEDINE
jgi:hypothetical protein